MTRFAVFSFDGTGNEPEDAKQETKYGGKREDDNISNVLKLHLMLGGNLYQATSHDNQFGASTNQEIDNAFYYQGVGTYGGWFSRAINSGLALEKLDVSSILRRALKDYNRLAKDGVDDLVLLVTGFSRGAALARRFVTLIERSLTEKNATPSSAFVYLCVWDTVASIGLPNLSTASRPDYDVVFENGCTISNIVINATHMVSLDDKRRAFQPTLMNHEEHILELWFAGAHSDVGGGYYRDGLSDVALSYAMKWLHSMHRLHKGKSKAMPLLDFGLPTDEMLAQLSPKRLDGQIGQDDLLRNPNPLGKNHQQDRWPVVDWLTLDDRVCCVITYDKIDKTKRPVLHYAVPVRIHRDENYRPKSLRNVKHQIWYDFDSDREVFDNISVHKELIYQNWTQLNKGESKRIMVDADRLYNHTGVLLQKGERYQVVADSNGEWHDRKIACSAAGWDVEEEFDWGFKRVAISAASRFKRLPNAKYFSLCGAIGTDDDTAFDIGLQHTFSAEEEGELTLFANDLPSKYGNNWGAISVEIKRI